MRKMEGRTDDVRGEKGDGWVNLVRLS